MHQTQSHRSKTKHLTRRKRLMSTVKGVSHLSRRAKRRLFFKLQLWMWRKRREKSSFGFFRAKKKACGIRSDSCLSLKAQPHKNKRKAPTGLTVNLHTSTAAVSSPLECDTKASGNTLRGHNYLPKPQESVSLSESATVSSSLQKHVTETKVAETSSPQRRDTHGQFHDTAETLKCCHIAKSLLRCPAGLCTVTTPGQNQASNTYTDERFTTIKSYQSDVSLKVLIKDIHEFLNEFYRMYGSFIPLKKSDVLRHLKRKFNMDFNDRKNIILSEIHKHRSAINQKPVLSFRVVYKKHTLTLDDLLTLADQNWLNDQVMNMYGELIMESAHHKVHFLNSFFHRQLMTKGYDGVKRWTKQVDLFSKSLLLVPVHLEVHWCLVTADFVKKRICLYDSQGHALQKVARNILKYLMTEAKQKQQMAFENGWTVSFDEKIPQQTNENDCGVFVLEYSRCLAFAKPLQFSQEDIPKIRKRIYKELCDCKLQEDG